ncbi:MAG: hypothetical protein AAF576_03350, partial [Pseudomonadota bacterium]
MGRLWGALCLILSLGGASVAAETVTLTNEELLGLAGRALTSGDAPLAAAISRTYLEENPEDARAHLILGRAVLRLEDTDQAFESARKAYRLASDDPLKTQAAVLAAEAALIADRLGVAERWFARAAWHAGPGPERDALRRALARTRQLNPTRVFLSFSVQPSSNVNGGANSASYVAEGVPFVGTLSESAQALSGTVADLSFAVRHRVRETRQNRTTLGFAAFAREVWLSDDAQEKAPDLSDGDLAYRRLDVSLRHEYAVGPTRSWEFGATFGADREGGVDQNRIFALDTVWRERVADDHLLRAGLRVQWDDPFDADDDPATTYALRGAWRVRAGPGVFSVTAEVSERDTDDDFERFHGASLSVRYAFRREGWPVTIALSAGQTYTRYPDYTVLGVPVTDGRRDRRNRISADATFDFEAVAGFRPVLSLTAEETHSNVSRFETE